MNIELPRELEELVQHRISSGRYRSAGEVIGEALRLLEYRDEVFQRRHEEIRGQIEQGWESAQRGEFGDGEAVFDRIDAELGR